MKKTLRVLLYILFCIYCLALVKFLFLDGRYYSEDTVRFYYSRSNFVPFKTVYDYILKLNTAQINSDVIIKNIVGNFVVLLPMGCFLPCMFQVCRKFKNVFFICVGIVLVVELLQPLLRIGFFDIDDLILNLSGACLGFLFVHVSFVNRLLRKAGFYGE